MGCNRETVTGKRRYVMKPCLPSARCWFVRGRFRLGAHPAYTSPIPARRDRRGTLPLFPADVKTQHQSTVVPVTQ
jgi:hypothetical protein